jgi:uncharacterized protein (DUF58 family)
MGALKLLFLILAALVAGQVTGWPVADHLALALLVLLIVSWLWSRTSLRSISLTETVTDRTQVGQPLVERLTLRNGSRLAKLWLEVVDHSTLPHHAAGRVVHVAGRGAVRWDVETLCARRGRFRVGPQTLRAGDPLGLFPRQLAIPESHEVLVYPAVLDLRGLPLPVGSLSGGAALERRTPFVTPSVAGVRDYTPGDAFNRISWSATARLGRLMVKEFDHDPTADVWLILDLERVVQVAASRPLRLAPDARGRWPIEAWLDSTEEYGVTIVASLARRFLDEGRNVGLIASGAHLEVIPADRSDRQYVKLLETLAVVRADGGMPLSEVLVAEGRRFSRQTTLVAVTPSTDEGWGTALIEIAGRGVRVAAILVEPETFGPAPSALFSVSRLVAAGVPVHLVKYGDNITDALVGTHGASAGRLVNG